MKLDLEELLQEINLWKNILKQKDEEIENLKKQLSFTHKQNEVLEFTRTSLLGEIDELNNTVASLRNSFSHMQAFEEDRRNLIEEKQKLKESLDSLEKLYYEKNKDLSQEIQKLKEANKTKTSKLISEIKNEASKQLEIMKKELERKENDFEEMKSQMTKLLEERDQEVLKMKIQYEDKIGKLKQQTPKSRTPTSHGLQMHDIFRQKYLKLEKDSEEEILKLKAQIQTLNKLVDSWKYKTGSVSLSSALFASNKSSVVVEVATQTENGFSGLLNQSDNQASNDDVDFEPINKKFNKTQSIVLPQKRKLFNLNQNYFVK